MQKTRRKKVFGVFGIASILISTVVFAQGAGTSVSTVEALLEAENAALRAKLQPVQSAPAFPSTKKTIALDPQIRIDRIGMTEDLSHVSGTINGIPFAGPVGRVYEGLLLQSVKGRCASLRRADAVAVAVKKANTSRPAGQDKDKEVQAFSACWTGVPAVPRQTLAFDSQGIPGGPLPAVTPPLPMPR